jgi:hypothetical protein
LVLTTLFTERDTCCKLKAMACLQLTKPLSPFLRHRKVTTSQRYGRGVLGSPLSPTESSNYL